MLANKIICKVTIFSILPCCCSDLDVTRTFYVEILTKYFSHGHSYRGVGYLLEIPLT